MRTSSFYKRWAILIVSFLLLLFIQDKVQGQTWYNSSWLYRKAITIDYSKVAAGPHTNFPLLISRVDADLQTKAQTDGDDILFTSSDGTTKLSHEVESYTSASGTLVAWVKIPSLSSAANTVIYMYYGNSMATNQQNITGTWETNFKGVYHLNNSFNDATSNGYNGTATGTANAAGQIANGRGYAAGNRITITGLMGNPANVTLSAWVNLSSLSSNAAEVVSLGDHLMLRLDNYASALDIVSFYYTGSAWNGTVGAYGVTGWHYIATTFDDAGNSQKNYLDGVLVTSTTGGNYTPSISYAGLGANTVIGNHGNGGANYTFLGTLDEVRVTGTARSAGWLWTEHNNQKSPSTFYGVGSEDCNVNISQIPSSNLILNYKFNGNANDETGTNNGTLQNNPVLTADRFGISNKAYTFNGSSQFVSTANAYTNPANITVSIWFKTATTTGGKLIGFGNSQTGSSTSYDRHIYMNNAGQIYFGVYAGGIVTINSPLAYNDNNWHLATATLSNTTGIALYIDGTQVATNGANYGDGTTGWWKIGYDNLRWWPSEPSSYYFNGTLDDAIIYHTALNATQIATIYNSPDGAGNNGPLCSGSTLNLTATTVSGATYAWTGPNGFSSTSQNPSFSYTSAYAGVYTVQVSSGGCAATAYTSVTTAASSSAISYAGSPYCINAGTATVSFSGTTGGTYSSTGGLSISASTGAVTLGASTAGTYTVTYTEPGGCEATTIITITALPAATISYAGSPFCKSLTSGQPVTHTGTTGGTYSSTAGLTVNASTGYVTPSTSTAGPYTVTYTIAAAGGCSVYTTTTSVTITSMPNISQIPASTILNYKFSGNANDEAGTNNGTLQNSPALAADRFSIANKAYTFNGSSQYVSTANAYTNPTNFTVSIWFKTATTSGGKLIGFGNAQTGSSTQYDRHIYMNNAGRIYFGVYTGSVITINSPLTYNDNNWHLVTATLSSTAGMVLYIDGAQVASNTNTSAQNYTGYWKIGFDNNTGWTSQPTSYYFNGTLDDALVYHTALNSTQVATLFNSPDGAGNNSPVCAGTTLNLTATTASGATYAWTGPNGFSSSSQNPSFSYSSAYAGVYTVQVTTGGCSATAYTKVISNTNSGQWTGNISTDWADGDNWCSGTVPTSSTNVIVNSTATRMPSIISSVACNNLTINTGAALTISTTGTLNIAGTLTNNSTITNNGTVNFNGTSGQQTFSGVSSFHNITLSNTSGLLLPAAIVVNNNLLITAGTLNANNFNIEVKGNWTNNVSTTAFTAGTSTVTFNSTNAQVIGGTFATAFNNLTIANTADTVSLNVSASLSGNLSIASGTFNLAGFSANRISAGGTLTIANNATLRIGGTGSFPSNFTTSTLEVASSVDYTGTTQTVKALTYGNLILSGAGTNSKTADGSINVNGVLNLSSANASETQGCLEMATYTLNMGASATTIGMGDVTGIIKRTTIAPNITYTFGNQFTTAIFPNVGTLPTEMSVKNSIGTAPSWRPGAIKREVEVIQTGGSGTKAQFSSHYLDTELNGNIEENMVVWIGFATNLEYGRSSYNTEENWVVISDIDVAFLLSDWSATRNFALDEHSDETTLTWNGSVSTSWGTIENWTPNVGPSSNKNIFIPDASTTSNDPTLPLVTEIKSMTIAAGGILNSNTASELTINGINGAWSNVGGTFNPNTSNVIFTNPAATMSGTTNFYDVTVADSGGLIPGTGNTMRVSHALTVVGTGVLRAAFLANTIEFNGADQVIVNPNGITPGYYNLILSGSGTKTMPGTALSVTGDFSMSGSASATVAEALSVSGNLTIGSGNILNLGSFSHVLGGNLTNNGGTLTSLSSSLEFNGSGPQTITSPGFTVNDLTITNTSADVTLGTSTNCSIGGNLTVDTGAVFDLASNSLEAVTGSVSNSGTIKTQNISSAPVPAGKTWDGYVEYTGTGTQTIVAATYNNLTMSGSGGATALANITVNGILNLSSANPSATKGILDMGSHTVLMGSASTTTGQGDVTGIVRRTTLLANTTYSFGHQYTTINFPNVGTLPSEMSLKISIGTAPVWKPAAVNRIYDLIQTGGSGTQALLHSHYLDSELNGITENLLVDYVYIFAVPILIEYGRSAFNTTNNWIAISNVNVGVFSSAFGEKEIAFDESEILSLTWNGSVSTSWVTAGNWTPNGAPSDHTAITIPDAGTTSFDPSLPAIATCGTMSIESGGILNSSSGAQLTINGADSTWRNTGGTFNAGTSTILFKNSSATMAGSSDFNNIIIDSAASLVLQNNTYLGISGTLTNNGNLGTVENGATTVEYKGAGQTVVVPSTNSYSTLILSGSGIKTMPLTDLNIIGNFSTSGTATATAGAAMTIAGDVTIGAGSSFITGSYHHSIGGNLDNSGSFTISAGNTITLNGTSSQSIQTIDTINFDNLTINNYQIVNLFDNINVNNALTLTNGNLSVGATTLGINGTISKTSGYIEVVPQSSLNFGGAGSITLDDNLFSSAPSINNLTINNAGGFVLGNQNMTVNGLLDLTAGTFDLGANTLTIAGSSPVRTSGTLDAGNAGATLAFINTTAITLPVSIFTGDVNNLTINGTGGVTASSDFTVNGILNLQSANASTTKGSLDMWDGSAVKILTMGANATTIGEGDVSGIVKRTTFIANTAYTFGNQFTSITFLSGGTYPSQIQIKIVIGTAPSWKTTAINRIYDMLQTGANNCLAHIIYHYLDAELNGNNENFLVHWSNGTPGPPLGIYEFGRSDYSTTDNWASIDNVNVMYLPTSFGVLESTMAKSELAFYTWNGSESTIWTSIANWTPWGTPSSISNVIIPDTATTPNDPTLPTFTEIRTMTIETAGILNAATNVQLTINGDNGAWSNAGGTFNPGNSNVIFTNASATISGTTDFYDVTIDSGAVLSMTVGSIMGIAGTMNNIGILHTIAGGPTTVNYNGGNQTVAITNPVANSYSNLILSGNGIKTMPDSALTIEGNLNLSDTVMATAVAMVSITGDLFIDNDCIFEIAPEIILTVSGTILNNAGASGFVLLSDSTGCASLIHNTNIVPATVERYISGAPESWHFISSPVADQPVNGLWLPSGTYGNGTGYDLYAWDENTSCWIYKLDSTSAVNWNTIHPGSEFDVARGYLYSVQAVNPTKTFIGKLNNGPVDIAVTFNSSDVDLRGFNLVGNPYPSTIDWASGSGWDRNSLLVTGGGYDVWIWNPVASNYGVYNSADPDGTGTNSVSRYIAPMQGYFVRAALNGNLGMDNGIRAQDVVAEWLKSAGNEYEKVSLTVKSEDSFGSDEIQLKFGYKSNEKGASKLFSNVKSAPSLYLGSGNDYMSVLYLTNTDENTAVPINFTPGMKGNYTLICDFTGANFETLLLEDIQSQVFHDLKSKNILNFIASKSDDKNRFILHFGPVNKDKDNKLPARIYFNGDNLMIDLEKITAETDVFVYDVLGHLLLQEKLIGETTHDLDITVNRQLLIVYLRNPEGSYSQKIIMNDP